MIRVGDRVIYSCHPDKPQGEVLSVDLQSGTAMVEWWPIGVLVPPIQTVQISDLEHSLHLPSQSSSSTVKCLCGGSSVYKDEKNPNPIYHDSKYCPRGKGK